MSPAEGQLEEKALAQGALPHQMVVPHMILAKLMAPYKTSMLPPQQTRVHHKQDKAESTQLRTVRSRLRLLGSHNRKIGSAPQRLSPGDRCEATE